MERKVAAAIRGLSLDMVLAAKSGHPGLPLGCADFFAWLFGSKLRYDPQRPTWAGRDYFVLSAGHGSAALYATLFLHGYDYTLDDLKNFRKLHSKTPGHPEYNHCPGVEATTGPLGQGFANSVGMALGLKMAAARFGKESYPGNVYALVGDGCLMEGISHEAASFAGHLRLGNLVLFYDANQVTLDAMYSDSSSDDVHARFTGYGWDVAHIDGLDPEEFKRLDAQWLSAPRSRPLLVVMKTVIGYGLHVEGTPKAHGEPPELEDARQAKKRFNLSEEPFVIDPEIQALAAKMRARGAELYAAWEKSAKGLGAPIDMKEVAAILKALPSPKEPVALRAASATIVNALAAKVPNLVGASADLSGSDKTTLKDGGYVTADDFHGRNIRYGIREFGMAAGMGALSLVGPFHPFCGTFFTFSDYMRNAIRLAALSSYPITYVFTHDSIFVGEDGPTHEPIEQLASLRAMPELCLYRPGSFQEAKAAWFYALSHKGPTAIILTRQNIDPLPECDAISIEDGALRGAYILRKGGDKPTITLFATGSELALAISVADLFEKEGKAVRVISVPAWERFFAEDASYQALILEGDLGLRVSLEAGSTLGWERFIGRKGVAIGIDRFGASANFKDIVQAYGFSKEAVAERIRSALTQRH